MINADLTKLSEAAFSQENETIKTKIRSLLVNLSMPKTSSPPSLVVSSIFFLSLCIELLQAFQSCKNTSCILNRFKLMSEFIR
jgi:hypothetical protein